MELLLNLKEGGAVSSLYLEVPQNLVPGTKFSNNIAIDPKLIAQKFDLDHSALSKNVFYQSTISLSQICM